MSVKFCSITMVLRETRDSDEMTVEESQSLLQSLEMEFKKDDKKIVEKALQTKLSLR